MLFNGYPMMGRKVFGVTSSFVITGLPGHRRPKPHYKLEARDTDYGAGRLLGLIESLKK